jgi:copper homeostasis protein
MNGLEIIVETLEDAISAQKGGATQLDLKAHFPCGGLTPSMGTVEIVKKHITIPIIMMIRPHARSFLASQGDIEISCADIRLAKNMGIRDFMTGFLTSAGELDVHAIKVIQHAAEGCRLHAHLAWELAADPWQALKVLIDLGFSSIHTGGLSTAGKAFGGSALDAIENIRKIAKLINNQMEIFLAGSISFENATELIHSTGVTNLHCGRGVRTPPTAEGMVDIQKVKALRQAQLSAILK